MKIGITAKFFLAIVLTSLAAVLLMVLTVRYRFHHDFLGYVNQAQVRSLNRLAGELASQYRRRGDWAAYRHHPANWRAFLQENLTLPSPGMMMHHRHMRHSNPGGEHMMASGPSLANRLALLDTEKRHIAGLRRRDAEAAMVAIVVADKTVGWLSLNPGPRLTALTDISFQENQMRTGLVVAALAVLLAAMVAVFLARQFRYPIKRLVDATRRLTAGDFSVRIEHSNRDEFGQLQADFNRLASTFEANEKARRQWQADISHELRTPTAVLRGEIEALQDGVREVNETTLQSLHAEVLHISKIIEDLYQLSMSDIGALSYKKEVIDLVEIVETVIASNQARLEQKRLSTRVVLAPCESVRLFADAGRIRQLFDNLMQNSLRYTDPGGQLEIWCETRGHAAVLHWRDSAPGVDDDSLQHLFERLYRQENSRSRQLGGAGLGLSICYNIVAAHEGKITARHSPSGGLWVEVEFPAHGD